MYKCPHCNKNGIPFWHKLRTGSLNKATCKICLQKSYTKVGYGFLILLIVGLIFWFFVGVAILINFLWVVALSIPTSMLILDFLFRIIPMEPLTEKKTLGE